MKIVNSFHVSLLKKVSSSHLFPERPTFNQPDPVIVNKNDSSLNEWEVDEIIGKRKRSRRIEYLVKWKNCLKEDNSWEPVSNLTNSTDLVRRFETKEMELNSRRKKNSNSNTNSVQVSCTVNQTQSTANRTYANGVTPKQSNINSPTMQTPIKLYSTRILTPITPITSSTRIIQRLQCSARIRKGKGRRCRNKTLK